MSRYKQTQNVNSVRSAFNADAQENGVAVYNYILHTFVFASYQISEGLITL